MPCLSISARFARVVRRLSKTSSPGRLPVSSSQSATKSRMASFWRSLRTGGVGVAEHAGLGVAGEEGENPVLAARALGDVVLLDQRLVAMVGDRVEVEVERGAGTQALVADGMVPRAHQRGKPARVDPRAVFGECRALGHGVEAGEERQAGIEDLGHGLRGPADAPELEGEQRAPGGGRGDHGAPRHVRLVEQPVEIEGHQHRDEDEQPAEAGAEGAVLDAEGAMVGDRRDVGADDVRQHRRRAPGQPRQPGLADHLGHGRRAGGTALGAEDVDDLVDGHPPLPAQGQDAVVAAPARGRDPRRRRLLRPLRRLEEGPAGIGTERGAEVAEGPDAVAEGLGCGPASPFRRHSGP